MAETRFRSEQLGPPVSLGPRPVPLVEPSDVWLVDSGEALVFAVALRDGQPSGRRRFLASLPAGEAAFAPPPLPGCAVALVIDGDAATVVRRLDRGAFAEAEHVSDLLDAWTGRLTAGIAGQLRDLGVLERATAPPASRALAAGSAAVQAGEVLRSGAGVLWVAPSEGSLAWFGLDGLTSDALLPLADPGWAIAGAATIVTASDTGTARAAGAASRGLDALGRLVLRAAERAHATADTMRFERIGRAAERDALVTRRAVDELAAVVPDQRPRPPVPKADDPLLAAAREIGAHEGFEIAPPPRAPAPGQELAAIAKASRVRTRRVRLEGRWWQADIGPVLAAMAVDDRPVALLPRGRRGYELVDPARGERRRVDADLAAALAPTGHVLYRTLPARPLRAREVLAFGLSGTRRDQRRAMAFGLGAGLIALATPVATSILFGSIIPSAARGRLVAVTGALVLAAAAAALFLIVQGIALVRIQSRFASSLQPALWDRLLRLPPAFFRRFSTGELLQRALAVDQIQQLLSSVALTGLLQVVFLGLSFALLFVYEAQLALVATVLVAIGSTVLALTLRRRLRLERELQVARGEVSQTMLQLIGGIAKLRVAGAEERGFAQWAKRFAPQAGIVLAIGRVQGTITTFGAAWPAVTSLVLIGAVALRGVDSVGTASLIAFLAAFTQILTATQLLGTTAASLIEAVPLFERARPIFDELPEVDEAKGDPGRFSGQVQLHEVDFRYDRDGPPVLEGVSLRVDPGEFVALVGPSGAGKSSTLRLILGFEHPDAGSVHLDGRDLAGLDVEAVRRQIGVVLQNDSLLPGTVFSNIAGESSISLDEAWEAAALVGLEEDIRKLPMGMQTIITEGGSFSGGERQRLMIARALANRPQLLLFDEATSALDNITQRVVSETLRRLGLTRIIIAHRLTTIRAADRIVVLDRGRVVQEGAYDELVASEGLFQTLARRQLA